MADTISAEPPDAAPPRPGGRRPLYLVAVSVVLILLSGFLPAGVPALGTLALGVGIFVSALALHARQLLHRRGQLRVLLGVSHLLAGDPAVSVVADAEGDIHHINPAGRSRFRDADVSSKQETGEGGSVVALLRGLMANPASVVYRLQKRAEAEGVASDTVSTRSGQVALSLHDIGGGLRLWRIEENRATATEQAETGLLPRLTVGRGATILFMNAVARKLIGKRVSSLDRLSSDPLENGKVISLDTATGPVARLVSEVALNGGRRELFFLPPPAENCLLYTSPSPRDA